MTRTTMEKKEKGKTIPTEEPSRWEVMARERNARVVLCNTPDTYAITDLARHADRCVRALRNRLLITLSPEVVLPLLEKYKMVVIQLHEVISEMCKTTDIRYKAPRSVKSLLGEYSDEQKEDDEPKDKTIDKDMAA